MQRTALVVGVANSRSLAWSSALSLLYQGDFDHVVVTYQERFKSSIERMVEEQNTSCTREYHKLRQTSEHRNYKLATPSLPKCISCLPCDISRNDSVESLFSEMLPSLLHNHAVQMGQRYDFKYDRTLSLKLDAMVHSIAYAPVDAMKPTTSGIKSELPFLHTSKDAFDVAHSISSYSLLTLAKNALPLMSSKDPSDFYQSPSITALSYIGSSRAVPNYNIMGPAKASLEAIVRYLALELSPKPYCIRVNAVSSGPVNTLAARGIKSFVELKNEAENRSMMKRGVTGEEVGNVVAFLADGKRSSGITGQVLFCDAGYSSFG